MKPITITRKIQLLFSTTEKAELKSYYDTLYKWQYIVFKAANWISTHHYIQENLKDIFYLTDETKIKLSNIKKDQDGILTTSKMNTTYQLLSKKFKGEIPMGIITSLNSQIVSVFNKEKGQYWKGERSLRSYRLGMPIPIVAEHLLSIALLDKNYSFTLYGVPFKTNFGRDHSGNKSIFDRFLAGESKLCNSSIQIKDNKIFLLAVFQIDQEQHDLSKDVQVSASLDINIPIVAEMGARRLEIGTKEEYLYRRLAIQGSLRRMQSAARFNKGGKGRGKKMESIESFHEKETNYIKYRLHVYSKKLIDFCLKSKAGVLILKDQSEKQQEAKKDEYLLKNWSYYGLIQMIKYKAERVGIEVIIE